MTKRIDITREESENIENLYMKYLSYMGMLQYLSEHGEKNDFCDKKWDEASQLWIELDKAKCAVEKKYKPEGNWDKYEFDFSQSQVVFSKE